MLDKFKRLFPKLNTKWQNKKSQKKEEVVEPKIIYSDEQREVEPVIYYKYLKNSEFLTNANVFTQLWYLRGKLDWFDEMAINSKVTSDSFAELLLEITTALSQLAFKQKDMGLTLSLLSMAKDVTDYYYQYTEDYKPKEDFFDYMLGENANFLEQIWYIRYMYDCGCVCDNYDIFKDVSNWLKTISKKVKSEDLVAIKRILKDVNQEKHQSYKRNLRSR